jgi:hypothetical protein
MVNDMLPAALQGVREAALGQEFRVPEPDWDVVEAHGGLRQTQHVEHAEALVFQLPVHCIKLCAYAPALTSSWQLLSSLMEMMKSSSLPAATGCGKFMAAFIVVCR